MVVYGVIETQTGEFEMTREEWLLAFTAAARPAFEEAGSPLPETVRLSVGFPSKGARSSTIGECHYGARDGVSDIFLRPSLQDDSRRIAGVLVHELIHAAGHRDHKAGFRKCALVLGLEGKMTATTEGDKFYAWADPILAQLGAFPGVAMGDSSIAGGKQKQTTRMKKVSCSCCGWSFRTSQQNIDNMTDHTCLACGDGQLETE